MAWTVADIAGAVARAHRAMSHLEQELNAADAKVGDGDTGVMLARVLDRMAQQDLADAEDVGAAFGRLARAAMTATGSSLGTLFATALMTFAKDAKGQATLEPDALGPLLAKARDAMMARGGAALGDKTILDSLDAVVAALDGVREQARIGPAVVEAAEAALEAFRGRPNKRGRARMFGDATVGLDDPGMLAFAKLARAAAA